MANATKPDNRLQRTLEQAIRLMGAAQGNVQLYERHQHTLRIVAHAGHSGQFLEHFKAITSGTACCGLALKRRQRVIVEDVEKEPLMAHLVNSFKAYGIRAVQSTPLFDENGTLVGILSTHFPEPHRPTASQLQALDALLPDIREALRDN
jgi:GAF domain-containing protein